MPTRTVRSEKLDLRLTSLDKKLLRAAASIWRRSLSEFVLDSARARADETLADRRAFVLGPRQWQAFVDALNAPPRPLPRMQRLLTEPGFFDTTAER